MSIDWSPLTRPVSRGEVTAFIRRQPRIRRSSYMSWFEIAWVVTLCLAVATLIFTVAADDAVEAARSMRLQAVSAVVVMLMAAWTVARRRKPYKDAFRFERFAAANGFGYSLEGGTRAFPATGFGNGRDGNRQDVIILGQPLGLEIGSCRSLTGSGDNTRPRTWKYAQMRLRSPFPHIVLDAKSNGSTLQEEFVRGQRLNLGGDLDRLFTLYAPAGYEDDVRQLFTPELTAHLAGVLQAWDVEIIDDMLFLFSDASAAQKPAAIRGLVEGAATLAGHVAAWGEWRDSRLPSTEGLLQAHSTPFPRKSHVAPQGQRLKTRLGWGTWIMLAVMAGGFVVAILKGLGVLAS
ncbi:hypothetical protein [Arthrobacter sp. GMC3]|uniref:hypothetical protein n=1 Tax=Arthrobacter sp. GMC3 TaxID=2058894 RepID=UPI000CE53475|nr:hypothetical protein [Arthrobacter sp. GMC3]